MVMTSLSIAILGSGAVGGYYGAKLANAGHKVTFLARGQHLQAIHDNGLMIRSLLGDLTVRANATDDASEVGHVDVVLVAVKTYDNKNALPMLKAMVGPNTTVLTLQNGVDSVDEIDSVIGEAPDLGGATYIATAGVSPGLIEQTGTHRQIVFGEVFGERNNLSKRVENLSRLLIEAEIEVEAVKDARVQLWEKLIYLSPFAGFTGASRLPTGPVWTDPEIRGLFMDAVAEVEQVARAYDIPVSDKIRQKIIDYMDSIPGTTRSSLLIDLSQGKRLEVDALLGSVMRRGRTVGVATPVTSALYAVLKPHAGGRD